LTTLYVEPPSEARDAPPPQPLTPGSGRPSSELKEVVIRHRIQRWIRIPEVQVGLVAALLSIAAFAYYAHAGLLFAYPDAVSHFMIARRVSVSRTPGLAQFGTSWLPLTHALMLPLVWVDVLWRDGLAGSLPSMVAYVVAGIYMFRLGKLVLKSDVGGYLAALALALNPSLIYLQATAMSETDLITCTVILTFYLVRWTQDESWSDLIKCAAACCAATLIRYDGWALTAAAAIVVMYTTYRRHGWIRARAAALLFGLLGFAGCVGWSVYNQVFFNSALGFLTGPYSVRHQGQHLETEFGLATHYNLLLSTHSYAQAVVDNVGLLVVVAAGAGLVIHLVGRSRTRLATCVLLAPFAFNVLSLYLGINVLRTPEITGPGQTPTYANGRYALEMLPAVALFLAIALTRLLHSARARLRTQVAVASIATGLLLVFAIPQVLQNSSYALQDPLHGQSPIESEVQVGTYLHQHAAGQSILISYSPFAPAIFFANLPDHAFVTDNDTVPFHTALTHPNSVEWIVVDPQSDSYDPVWSGLQPGWQQRFVLVATYATARIYQRIT
jgi:hypothetical protein